MQQTANQLHQQNAALQIQLERQSLQNKLLQQTMENEQLRKELEQQGGKRPPMVNGMNLMLYYAMFTPPAKCSAERNCVKQLL